MDEALKKRLIGATVLVSLVVIFVPMLLEHEPIVSNQIEKTNIPERPKNIFSSSVLPLESEKLTSSGARKTAGSDVTKPKTQKRDKVQEPKTAVRPPSKENQERIGLSAWVVQVGSFSKSSNAEKVIADLQKQEYAAFLERVEVKGKTLHRVLVGPEVDRKKTEQMRDKLNKILKKRKLVATIKRYH